MGSREGAELRRQVDQLKESCEARPGLWDLVAGRRSPPTTRRPLCTPTLLFAALLPLILLLAASPSPAALARIALIKILPYWDWRDLFYDQCIINNPYYGEYSLSEEDCMVCESLENIDSVCNITHDILFENYISRDSPVIVTDAMNEWPSMKSNSFNFNNITELFLYDEKITDTLPCSISTNIRHGSSNLIHLLHVINNPNFQKWFIHWNNCELSAVKAMRQFYSKPYFLSSAVSPPHFSWVMMSSNYTSNIYKKVELRTGLVMVAQVRGETLFNLIPSWECERSCRPLKGTLSSSQILVFPNFLWSFEYTPRNHMENIAFIMEASWEDNF